MISAEFQMRTASLFSLLCVNLQGKSTHFKHPSLILILEKYLKYTAAKPDRLKAVRNEGREE